MKMINPAAFERRPEAVLFDLDDTLYSYDRPHAEGMRAVRHKLAKALNVGERSFEDAFAAARRAVKDRLGHTASSHSRLLYFARTVEGLGFGPQPVLALDLEQTYWRTFLANAALAPGAEDLLAELRSAGVKLGLVTDLTSQIQFRKLVYFGLDRVFDAVVTSEEAGVEKVGLVPFEMAAAKLGLAAGARVWMVGDSVSDMEGSRTWLGAATVQKVWGTGGVLPGVDAVVQDFGELVGFVRERLGV